MGLRQECFIVILILLYCILLLISFCKLYAFRPSGYRQTLNILWSHVLEMVKYVYWILNTTRRRNWRHIVDHHTNWLCILKHLMWFFLLERMQEYSLQISEKANQTSESSRLKSLNIYIYSIFCVYNPHSILTYNVNFSCIYKCTLSRLLVVKEGSSEVQLFSIHSNPFNSNEFCVGGRSHYVRVYDRRKVTTPLYKLCPDHLVRRILSQSYC